MMSEEAVIILVVVACAAALVIGVKVAAGPVKRLWQKYFPIVRELYRPQGASVDEWDQVSLLYRVPSSTVGFLAMEHVALWLTTYPAAGGGLNENLLWSFFTVWMGVIGGLDHILGIIGAVGLVGATVYGVHQDLPKDRLRALAAVAVCGVLIGLGLRFS